MCEIIFTSDGRGVRPEAAKELFTKAILPAAQTNPHGWGFFAEDEMFKSVDRPTEKDAATFAARVSGRRFIVAHVRVATHGAVTAENAHPFTRGDWTLVHNGVVDVPGIRRGQCDSEAMLWAFVRAKGSALARLQTISKTVSGWASVFIYQRSTGVLYYFLNGFADFTFARQGSRLYGATKKARMTRLSNAPRNAFFCDLKNYADPDKGTLYCVDYAHGRIRPVGGFRMDTASTWHGAGGSVFDDDWRRTYACGPTQTTARVEYGGLIHRGGERIVLSQGHVTPVKRSVETMPEAMIDYGETD